MLLSKLTCLAQLTDALSRATFAEDVYSASLDCLQASLGVDRASILLFDDDGVMSFVAWRGISDEYRAAVNGHTPWRPESANAEPVLVRDWREEPSLAAYASTFDRENIRALGFFALAHRDRVIGKFMLYYAEPHDFTEEEVALAKTIAGQIAFGLARLTAEQALQDERERLEATVANIPGMVWETVGEFPNDMKVTYVSDGIRDLIGYEPSDWKDDPKFWLELMVERPNEPMQIIAADSIRDATAAVHQYRLRRRDGSTIWVEVRSAHRRVNGTLISRGVTMDVTARRRAEERNALLSEARGALSATLEYEKSLASIAGLVAAKLGDWCLVDLVEDGGVVRIAAEHRDARHAAAMRRLQTEFAPSKHELGLGRDVFESGAPLLLRELDDETRARLNASSAAAVFAEIGCDSLMIVPISAATRTLGAISIGSADASTHFDDDDLAVATELGRRAGYAIDHARMYRQTQAANRAKDEFLATLSHELRTPMTAALGWTSLLQLGETSPETTQLALETIGRSIRAQAKLIDDIFDVSRIVTGKLHLQIAPVDLHAVIRAAVETIQQAITTKNIQLQVTSNASDALLGDAARLQQVVWNLLSNAVRFTPPGGSVRVDVQSSERESVISVRDTGQGISKRLLPFVFDRFRQGDSGSTRAHGGLGLGLAIVKNLVELHGGTVTAESDGEGCGAVFTVRLPSARPEQSRGTALAASDPAAVSLAGIVVLVVEDDDDTRVMLTTTLERHGASVIAVSSAPAALDALRDNSPHVVLSDIAMPGEDGVSLMMKIRSGAVESARNVPAIAITAYARPEDRERLLAAGFHEHLRKPVDTATMLRSVRDAVMA